jgi:phage tail sheath protein FI
VAGNSTSGANPVTTLPAAQRSFYIDVNGDGPQLVTIADPATTGLQIAQSIATAVAALKPQRPSTSPNAFIHFAAAFSNNAYVLSSGTNGKSSSVRVTNAAPASNAAAALKLGISNLGAEATGGAPLRPALGSYALSGAAVGGNVLASTSGADGATPQDNDYINAFQQLNPITDVNILAVPGIGTQAVVDAGSNYATQRRDCFFIGDPPYPALAQTAVDAQNFVNSLTVKSSYSAVYFPWLLAVDPRGIQPTPVSLPPSGYLAGIYARIDARRGVWKAPAGTEANLGGTVGVAVPLTDANQDTLNPIGANLIRFFSASGVVVWGARTLATRANPEYRYVPVRRLAIFLERSIYNGIQWAVFEPNDETLWASLRLNIGAFMMNQFRAGAFQGSTPAQAFFVKCDAQTNPQSQIDAGIVTVLVGFAPVKPAEFVVIQISQQTAASST